VSATTSGRVTVRNVYPFTAADRAMLDAVDPRLVFVHDGDDDEAWIDALSDPDVEVLSASYPPADRTGMPRLRWLASAGAGIEYLAERDPWGNGIEVTNGSGLHAVAMAEYALGAVMLASERLEARLANRAREAWQDVRFDLAGRRLRGRTALIVGYGSVGREAARLLHATGMRILAVKADPTARLDAGWREPGTGDPDGSLPDVVAGPDRIRELVADADFVVLSLPITNRTRGIVDASILAAMRPDAWIVNVGRGALIDEASLLEALQQGRIGGAVLDVFVDEPLPPGHLFWSAPNCLVTPHVSGLGGLDAFWRAAAELLAENLRRDLDGAPHLNVTSPVAGY
jgi:phosphoglycerate dehydrogenase-like enzyme